jgi:hypothetical protein
MKCKICGAKHANTHPHYKLVRELTSKGFPTHSADYAQAHRKANKAEEKQFGKRAFNKLEKYVKGSSKHELIGKNLKSGKLEVSKKVPKKMREEVAYHEEVENKILRKRK